jgi:NDP-sugar pyrophosphorylase family protein
MTKPSVVIIAGGASSRFFPFNFGTFKGAISLMGKPLIVRALENLQKQDYQKVVIVVSPQNFQGQGLSGIIDKANLKLDITFVLQPEAKGMGDALLQAREHLPERFVVTSGYHLNLGEQADQLLEREEANVVSSAPTNEPWDYGILTLKDNKPVGIIEKPAKGKEPSNQKIQTLYVLNQDFINILAKLPISEYNFEKALDVLMKDQAVGLVELDQGLPTLKYAWHLFGFQQTLFSQMKSHTSAEADVAKTAIIDDSQGPVVIEAGAQVGDFVKIIGPCFIGEKALVGDYSFIRGGCSIETGASIGSNTEVVRSIILSHSTIHFGYLADSIIGNHVKIGAGLITANKRLDRSRINITVKGHKISTSREAFGVMIGDEANLGIRVSTMPGVCIGSQAVVHPDVTIYRNLDHQQTLRE